jgi:putative heme-binding domain-containing protein
VLSSIGGRTRALIDALAETPGFFDSAAGRSWLGELAMLVGTENRPEDIRAFLDRFAGGQASPGLARVAVLGLGRGLQRSGGSLRSVLSGPASERVAPLFAKAAEIAAGEGKPEARVDAIGLLALGSSETALKVLPDLLDARQPASVQLAAVQALAAHADPAVGPAIVAHWKLMGPAVRREAAEALFTRPAWVGALLDGIEAKTIGASELDPARRKGLLTSRDRALRTRAEALLSKESRPDRGAVIAQYRKALELTGDGAKGKGVFTKVCATCHRAEGQGAQVGPDLATVTGRSPEDLLIHILDPNREVAPNYLNYVVVTMDGRSLSGLIAEETAGAVTLKRAEAATDVVTRKQIEEIASTGLSLMPEGLEQGLDPQAFADLIAYIRSIQGSSTTSSANPAK